MVCYGMMSKFRKWHLREPKFAKFPRGACPRFPLEACAFGTNNYSLFSITWGWNLCTGTHLPTLEGWKAELAEKKVTQIFKSWQRWV